MIEYRHVLYVDGNRTTTPWQEWPVEFALRLDDFERMDFKVDGSVYTECNKNFEQAIVWEKLSNDTVQSKE